MHFRRTSRTTVMVGVTLLLCLILPAAVHATSLAPFIDLQERGLTVSAAGVGTQGWNGSPRNLTVNIGGPVRFALLYWAGRQRPCDEPDKAICEDPVTEPYRDQDMIFAGNALRGTIIGNETQPASGGGPIYNIGYYADVTSIVAARGTGNQTFTFADGNTASNLWRLNGASLIVAWTDAANPNFYRVLVWDGLDFAYGPDPTPGPPRVTVPVTFNHGANLASRSAQLWMILGDGTKDRPENITISNNSTLFNVLSGSSGFDWDSMELPITLPANVGTTTVQANSAPNNQNPDSLLWEVAALRVRQLDAAKPTCPLQFVTGPPAQVIVTARDGGTATATGLASIVVTRSENADTVVPPFTVGSTDPLTITSTKIDQSQRARVEIEITDVAGNTAVCDPIVALLIRDSNQPETQTFRDVPQAEGKVSIVNGTPGIKSVEIFVNGVKYKAKNLSDGETAMLDIAPALHAGNDNVVSVKAKGKKGGWADIVIWDGIGQ
jgi:hypothetical protein